MKPEEILKALAEVPYKQIRHLKDGYSLRRWPDGEWMLHGPDGMIEFSLKPGGEGEKLLPFIKYTAKPQRAKPPGKEECPVCVGTGFTAEGPCRYCQTIGSLPRI